MCVYEKLKTLLQFETAHWVPNLKVLLILSLVSWDVLYKEVSTFFVCCYICYANFGFPKERKKGIFMIEGDAEKSHKCSRIIVNVH